MQQMERPFVISCLTSHTILLAEICRNVKELHARISLYESSRIKCTVKRIFQLFSSTPQNAEPAVEVPAVQSQDSVNQLETPIPVSQLANGGESSEEVEDIPVEVQHGKLFAGYA